ncbi:cell filamentation protein Fic [Streptomyces sp. NPDC087897]|uniref:cell filamentation protein Fic n=1 Tax=Streptomyces sp. NPDC087897 TaxID=3365817 RepID=UPI00382C3D6D
MTAWSHGEAESWADAMSYALAEHYGKWSVGWRWSHDEGDFDGGPVGHWCCPHHSITTPDETLVRVGAALREWREWLEFLARCFEAYPLDLAGIGDQRILWERAARHLILQVVDRTGCGSGWHRHCRQVLTWFLDHGGIAPDVAEGLVDEAIGGRFRSWTGPGTVVVDSVAERLALSLRPADARAPADAAIPPDHLRRWLTLRASVAWHEALDSDTHGPVVPLRDGAAEDIRAFDGAIAPARAEGLLRALELLRTDAARGARLDFALLGSWQQHVLGTPGPPRFRDAPAFAKRGRERYGLGPDILSRFDACLAGSASDADPPLGLTARAARAYLDVCFFHPFDDGNARSAFLTLVFVLAREGVALDSVSLLRRIGHGADDPEAPLNLAGCIARHIDETRRRAAGPAAR